MMTLTRLVSWLSILEPFLLRYTIRTAEAGILEVVEIDVMVGNGHNYHNSSSNRNDSIYKVQWCTDHIFIYCFVKIDNIILHRNIV